MMDNPFLRWLPVVLWAAFIFSTSANPDPYQPLPGDWTGSPVSIASVSGAEPLTYQGLLGRFSHAAEYVVLAVFTARALVWRGELRLPSLIVAFGICALYAISDEIHQVFVPVRAFQWSDLALDVIGCVIGLAAYAFLHTSWKQRAQLR